MSDDQTTKAELRVAELERIIRSEMAHSRTQADEINDLYAERDRLRDAATDPLGMLGAPAAYSNGEALTVKERLAYLLARAN